jgi:hypothetical protein
MNRTSIQDDFVEVRFEIVKDADGYPESRSAEALLCKPSDPECKTCVVKSIPFFLKDVAYGDTISTTTDPEGCLHFEAVIGRGGYSIYRLFLHDSSQKETLIRRLLDFDTLVESEGDLVALAVPPTTDADAVVDYILAGKERGAWGAQDGYISETTL